MTLICLFQTDFLSCPCNYLFLYYWEAVRLVHLCFLVIVVRRFDLCVFLTVSGLSQEDDLVCQRELNIYLL